MRKHDVNYAQWCCFIQKHSRANEGLSSNCTDCLLIVPCIKHCAIVTDQISVIMQTPQESRQVYKTPAKSRIQSFSPSQLSVFIVVIATLSVNECF